jgi:hypothetical protein
MTSFKIIGHRMHNWEWKFYKAKWLRLKLVFPPILVVNWVSSCLSFFLSASTACYVHDIFNAPTWTTTIISLKPCALHAETSFHTNFGGNLCFILCFFFPERLHCLLHDIFNAPTWTTTIISLKPCALYAEFQHFILRFSNISLLLQILYINSLRPCVRLSVCDHWTQRKVTVDAEKSDGKKIRRP